MSIPKLKNIIQEIHHKPIRNVAGVAVISDGKLLCVKRANTAKYPNMWAVPMGGVEKGETFAEAAARELKEETMLDFNAKDLLYLSEMKDARNNRMIKIFKANTDGKPKPTLDFEHTDWGYYDKDNLPRPMDNQLRRLLELNL